MNFQKINQAAIQSLVSLCEEWLPNGHKEGGEYKVGSLAGEAGRSLSINLKSGVWADFSSGDKGGDPISLFAAIRNISQGDSARELSARLGIEESEKKTKPDKKEWQPITVSDGAPAPTFAHYKNGNPTKTWEYKDIQGRTIGHICRFDSADGGKCILPLTYCQAADGSRAWRWVSFPKPRPLYGLELLGDKPTAGVLIVEGEKTADAARGICSGLVVTWAGGCKAVKYADWQPLKGRKVIIWPDRDKPGIEAAKTIARELDGVAAKVRIITPPQGDFDGWDLADAVAEGWDAQTLTDWIMAAKEQEAIQSSEEDAHQQPAQWEGTAPANQTTFKDDRISGLPFRLLGVEGDQFFYMPDRGQQIVSITAASHTKLNMMRLAPLQLWQEEFPDRAGCDWEAAANGLIQRNQNLPKFDPRRIRGRGCWIDGDDVVFHAGDRLVVNGEEKEIPSFKSAVRAIYEGALEIQVDSGAIATNADAAKIIELCEMLSWERPLYGKLLAGWLAIAPVCGALAWRPHLWLTGPSGSGKSWTVSNIIQPLVGRTAVHVQGTTSEAGIRQALGSDALPVVFDEAESEDRASQLRFDKVLELARQASTETGAGIVKGTASGGSVTYLIRSCFLFASIGVAAVKKADVSRVTVLPLRKNTGPFAQREFDQIKTLWRETIGQVGFCSRIRSRSLRYAKIIRANADTFSTVAVEFTGDKRSADQIGTLLAGAYSLTSNKEITNDAARDWMSKQDWAGFRAEEVDNDENQCLAHLFAAVLRFELQGHGTTMSVSEVLSEIDSIPESAVLESEINKKTELKKVLIRHGMRLNGGRLYVANRHQSLERIFQDTPWAGAKWRHQIERMANAERHDVMNFGSHVRQRAVSVEV